MKRLEIRVGGMRCNACVERLSERLTGTAGVRRALVTIGQAEVRVDDAVCAPATVLDAVRACGFEVLSAREV